VTSNSVEQYNFALLPFRKLPIHLGVLYILHEMGQKTITRLLHAKELERSCTLITPSVRDLHLKQCALAQTYRVDMKVYPSTTSNIGVGDVSRIIFLRI